MDKQRVSNILIFVGLIMLAILIFFGFDYFLFLNLNVSLHNMPLQIIFFLSFIISSWFFIKSNFSKKPLFIMIGIFILFTLIFTFAFFSKGHPCTDSGHIWAKELNPRHGTCSCLGIKKSTGFLISYDYCIGIRTKCYVISPNAKDSFIRDNFGEGFAGEIKLYSNSSGAGERYKIGIDCEFFDEHIFK